MTTSKFIAAARWPLWSRPASNRQFVQLIARNGGSLSWLIDLRSTFLNARVLDLITTAFWNDYKGVLPVQVGGMEVGAIPLVTALLLKAFELKIDVSGFIIRKQRKADGRGLAIEGAIGNAPIFAG